MTPQERVTQINNTMQAISQGWPFFMAELNERIATLTQSLISQNNDETRGRIKALIDLTELPVTLQQERDCITAELPETDSAL